MNKNILIAMMALAIALFGCAGQMEDRSSEEVSEEIQTGGCDYSSDGKEYVGKSLDECSRIRFMCAEGKEYFSDECGCGCTLAVKEPETTDGTYYVPTPKGECSIAAISCMVGMEAFEDDLGCGCRPSSEEEKPDVISLPTDGSSESGGKFKATDCTPSQKESQICTMEYRPVCGWFDSTKIQCIKYPCAQTFGNVCGACANPDVISWTEGECPA